MALGMEMWTSSEGVALFWAGGGGRDGVGDDAVAGAGDPTVESHQLSANRSVSSVTAAAAAEMPGPTVLSEGIRADDAVHDDATPAIDANQARREKEDKDGYGRWGWTRTVDE